MSELRFLRFFIPMIPPTTTHQMRKMGITKKGKPYSYDSPEVADARNKLTAHLASRAPKTPFRPPIQLLIEWHYPLTGKHVDGEYMTTAPDWDNSAKLAQDVMQSLGFFQDAHVAVGSVIQVYDEEPGLLVCIHELEKVRD